MGEERFSGGLWIQGDTGDYIPLTSIPVITEIADTTAGQEPVPRINTDMEFTWTWTLNINNRLLKKLLIPQRWKRPIRWRMMRRARRLSKEGK